MSATNKLIAILKKEDRTLDEIHFLKVYLSKIKIIFNIFLCLITIIQFFQQVFESFKASPEINNDLCRAVKYQTYPRYSIIFKQGDKNCDKAYIILKGRIMILMRDMIDVFQKESFEQKNRKSYVELLLENQSKQNDQPTRNVVSDKDFNTVLSNEYGKVIAEVEEGALFGEKALIENKPRAATICTKTACEFLILNKEDFEIIQSKYYKLQMDKKDFIMAQFPFLGNLITSARVFERVVRFFEEETYHKNQILFNEGVEVTPENQKLYIIISGEVQLYKNVTKQIFNSHSLTQTKVAQIHVATLGDKEIFGEELLENNNQNMAYQYTAICVSSNSQFVTVTAQIIDKKLPDQIKEYIQGNYEYKKNLRGNILYEHEKQQKDIILMKKNNKKDQFVVEKNLLTKLQQIQSDEESYKARKKKKVLNDVQQIQDIQFNNNIYNKIHFEFPKDNFTQIDENDHQSIDGYASFDQTIQIKDDLDKTLNDEKNKNIKQTSQYQTQQQTNHKYNKSFESEDNQNTIDERLEVIKGNSEQQNMFLFYQLRKDLNDKIKNEGGYQNDININQFYDNGQQEDKDTQQIQHKKCNPYPFKLTANHKHLKQLQTRLKQKKFQFADAQDILSKTKYYQAREKAISLQEMIEESQSKIQQSDKQNKTLNEEFSKVSFDQKSKKTQDSQKQTLQSIGKRNFHQINSPDKNENRNIQSKKSPIIIKKKIGITNMFEDNINPQDFGNNADNIGKNLFACSDKIKLHSLLKRISNNYKPHDDYFQNPSNALQNIEISKDQSNHFIKYYHMSNVNKNQIETRRILSRSPIIRRVNIAEQSAIHGTGVSIPSNKRYIIDNDHNVNDNYHFYKTSIRPSSDEARYGMKGKINENNMNQTQKLDLNNSFNNIQNNSFNSNIHKISVKYINSNAKTINKQQMIQIENLNINNSQSLNGSQRLHSIQNKQQNMQFSKSSSLNSLNRGSTIKKKSNFNDISQENGKQADFSFQNKYNAQNRSMNSSSSKLKQSVNNVNNSQNIKDSSANNSSKFLGSNISSPQKLQNPGLLGNNIDKQQDNVTFSRFSSKIISNKNIDSQGHISNEINGIGSDSNQNELNENTLQKHNSLNSNVQDPNNSFAANIGNMKQSLSISQDPLNVDDIIYIKKTITIGIQDFRQAQSHMETPITSQLCIDAAEKHTGKQSEFFQYKKQNDDKNDNNQNIRQQVESHIFIQDKNQMNANQNESIDVGNPLLLSMDQSIGSQLKIKDQEINEQASQQIEESNSNQNGTQQQNDESQILSKHDNLSQKSQESIKSQ